MAAPACVENRALAEPAAGGWDARLELRFERQDVRTVLAARRHAGPLRVQKPLYPEGAGVCQVVVVHPPGGIVAGDSLVIDIDAGAGTHAQLTTPGASKWYRSPGRVARADITLSVGAGALVEWLPQDTMLFDGARAKVALRILLAADARFVGWDVVSLGRTESGERFASGSLHQSLDLVREGTLLWCERTVIDGGSRSLQSGAILGGAPVFGTLVASGIAVHDDVRAACRAVPCATGDGAVTLLPQVLVARYRGGSVGAARAYFANLWRLLRPVLAGRAAVPPRIWNT